MSETEQEVPFEEPETETPPTEESPAEVPEGVDPETGEVTEPEATDEAADDDPGDEERRRELAAERQQAEQEEAQAQADAEKLMKQLNRTAENYAKKVVDLLGGDLTGWQACPLCAEGLPGFRVPRMPDPEYLAQVKVAIGEDPDPTLEGDSYSRPCDKCLGYGKVSTGSHVAGHKSVLCLDCKGRGYIAVGAERDTVEPVQTNGAPAAEVPQPLTGDPPRTPEEDTLRQLGAIVVWPPKPPDMATL